MRAVAFCRDSTTGAGLAILIFVGCQYLLGQGRHGRSQRRRVSHIRGQLKLLRGRKTRHAQAGQGSNILATSLCR
jgi:hypothetical protein